jgi:hypothetical protein
MDGILLSPGTEWLIKTSMGSVSDGAICHN